VDYLHTYYPIPGVCKIFTLNQFPPQPTILGSSNFTSRRRNDLATRIYFLFCDWRTTHDILLQSSMRRCRKYHKKMSRQSHIKIIIKFCVSHASGVGRPVKSQCVTLRHSFVAEIHCCSICILRTGSTYPKICKLVS
jgi:hypothetical protein